MCLIASKSKAEKAKKDIVCYKLVQPADEQGYFHAQYCTFKYMLGHVYEEDAFAEEVGERRIFYGFHSYRTQKDARLRAWGGKLVMLKCVIPKDARHYTSYRNDQYCSDMIKVVAWKPVWDWKWREKP